MGKIIDKSAFVFIVFLLSFLWLNFLDVDYLTSFVISFFILIIVSSIFLHLRNRYQDKTTISISEMEILLTIEGAQKTICRLVSTLPVDYDIKAESPYIYINSPDKMMYFINYKFSPLSCDDVVKARNEAIKHNFNEVTIYAKRPKRDTLLFMNKLEINIAYKDSKSLHRYLKQHNALPDKLHPQKKKKTPISFDELIENVFTKKRAKYFAFTGFTLALMSFFTPLTLYYLILGSISLAFTVLCLIRAKA